ncbi:adenine phosphoribosyltransferase [Micromonospora sp. ATCC 39149]|nr:adenine phosphoribosyltransferase [Micromonospora sp. ATCC 39149]
MFRQVVDGNRGVPRAGRVSTRWWASRRGASSSRPPSRTRPGVGVVPVRKAGKLPRPAYSASYALEYGEATLEVHQDAFTAGHRVLVVDDVLATGGTAEATLDLVERAGGTVAGFTVLLELGFLGGRERLAPRLVHALLSV